MKRVLFLIVALLVVVSVSAQVLVGARRMNAYLPLVEGRRVGVVTNHTGMVGGRHLVDTLLSRGVDVELVFAPEHGFRGTAAAGEHVDSGRDPSTGLEIVSLYGANRKPRPEQVRRCEVVLFDIQDVGCRFYTYLSTMHLVMEACAAEGIPFVVLDRPNPNSPMGVDGPLLDTERHSSFVGMHPIPVLHGMTLGELARMINGERWTSGLRQCDLTVIECEGWTRDALYPLPIAPSPALPNMRAVRLYPSLCFFEATAVSVGRGGEAPFQMLTRPDGTVIDLRVAPSDEALISAGIDLGWLIDAYRAVGDTPGRKFLTTFFENLMGVDWVRTMIENGASADEIRERWAPDVARFTASRKPYLLYN